MSRAKTTPVPLWRVRLSLFASRARTNWIIFAENPIGVLGLGVIVFFGLFALAHPILIATDKVTFGLVKGPIWDPNIYDPVKGYDIEIAIHPAPPSARHLLGTDPEGRDVLSQLMVSTRFEFVLGILTAVVTVAIATTVGAVTAYYGGLFDTFIMRFVDLVIMVPLLPILIFLSALMDIGMFQMSLIFGLLFGFGSTALIVKAQALTVKVRPYIDAARIAGGGDGHIIFKHMIPNLLPISLLYMMFTVNTAIAYEAILSFFGLTTIEMSWGLMINTTQYYGYLLSFDKWWLLFPASVAISSLCAAFYLVGRALDEVVNPRLRRLPRLSRLPER
jgi:peptide/nickel transport system permease protein